MIQSPSVATPEELEKEIAKQLAKNDGEDFDKLPLKLDKSEEPKSYCWQEFYLKEAKTLLPLFQSHTLAQVVKERETTKDKVQIITIDAINDYTKSKISFERCAEILDINFYELSEFVVKAYDAMNEEGD